MRTQACRRAPWAALALAAVFAGCAPAPVPQSSAPPPNRPAGTAPGTVEAPPPLAPARIDGEPTIDVGLAWDLQTITLSASPTARGGAMPVELDGPDGRRAAADGLRQVTLDASRGGVAVRAADSGRGATAPAPGDTVEVRGGGDGSIGWNGKSWRGPLRVFVNPRGKLTVVARLPLETYLLGVVPGEIGALADNLIEAGRAQAIAARSYTLFYKGRRATEGFDLYGTVEDQVYGSIESERPLATRVVRSTAGQIALWDGRPIRANYSSTCGGITSEVWEAWPASGLPYLVSHRDADRRGVDWCAASPHHRWREEWPVGELAENIARYAPIQGVRLPAGGVGEILDVRSASRSRSGRVWRLEVRTTTGTITVPAWSLRQVLRRPGNSAAILRSNLFKVDVRRDASSGRAVAVVASGAGSGHGAGLCQTGALGMARAGERGETILRHYYPGVAIERRW